mgnify:CR=1 FL=1
MAAEEHISLYTNILTDTPNNGYYSGVSVSREHSLLFPVLMYANSNIGPTVQLLSVRCDEHYETITNTIISVQRYEPDTGVYYYNYDPKKYLQYLYIAKDNGYKSSSEALAKATWSHEIEITDKVESRNTIFWIKSIPIYKKSNYEILTNLGLFMQTYTIKIS